MASYLITGTSRGIGLELVKQLLELPATQVSKIFAVTRGVSEGLQKLIDSSSGRVVNVVIEDISKENSVQKGVAEVEKHLGGKGLDCLVNNAGIAPWTPEGAKSMSSEHLLDVFNVNVVSAQVMISSFLPLLEKGEKKIVNVSTTLGSIALTKAFAFARAPAYKITKAAMNMLTTQYAMDLEPKGFTVICLSPGWLQTDLGSAQADLPVEVGVKSVRDIILNADPSKSGKFFNINVPGWENATGPNKYDGREPPW